MESRYLVTRTEHGSCPYCSAEQARLRRNHDLSPPAAMQEMSTLKRDALASVVHSPAEERGNRLCELSNAIVQLYKQTFGRGPTKSRACFAGPDTLVVLLEDSLTVAERNLAALGQYARLDQSRMLLHAKLENELRAIVERVIERRPIACISGIDASHGLSVEVLTLAPLPTPPSSAKRRP